MRHAGWSEQMPNLAKRIAIQNGSLSGYGFGHTDTARRMNSELRAGHSG
jgi:hypothetical protein